MGSRDLLSSFATLMRATGLDPTEADDDEAEDHTQLTEDAEEDNQRLLRAFQTIRDPAIRQALFHVVMAIVKLPN